MSRRQAGRRSRGAPLRIAALLAFATIAPVHALGAQSVHGTVVVAATRAPVNGGIVALLDENGRAVAATLADDSGSYALRAPAPGTFRLRVERVGFQTVLTPPFSLADGESRAYPLEVGNTAVALNAVKIVADKKCVVRPGGGLVAAQLWNEARKALSATRLAEAERQFSFRVRRFERELDPSSLRERSVTQYEQEGSSERPFVSIPVDSLDRYGFRRTEPDGSNSWFAPDADVLLSDRFLDSHCLMSVPLADGLVGLLFEPVSKRKLTDIKGVLWFDPQTAELRFLQYQYVNVDLDVSTQRLGGRIDFTKLPNGRWIVKRWYIRMPVVNIERYTPPLPTAAPEQRQVLRSIKEVGGEVLDVGKRGSGAGSLATIAGTVYDSVRGRAVAGARVFVSGTSRSAVSGGAGEYVIDSIPPGSHVVSVVMPRLDSLLIEPPAAEVVLSGGAREGRDFVVPSLESLARDRCGMRSLPRESAMLVGIVRDSITGRAVPDAIVRVAWQEFDRGASGGLAVNNRTLEATTTDRGRYALCALPLDRPLTVRVVRERVPGPPRAVRFMESDVLRLDLIASPAS